MIKPINDNSKYLIHKLSNGIKCLLIHDDRANKSAMSVTQGVIMIIRTIKECHI